MESELNTLGTVNAATTQEEPSGSGFGNPNAVGRMEPDSIVLNCNGQPNVYQEEDQAYQPSVETESNKLETVNATTTEEEPGSGFGNPNVVCRAEPDSIGPNCIGQPNAYQEEDQAYQDLLLSSTYLEDAIDGRTLPYKTDPISILQYRGYSNRYLQWLTIFFMWWNLCLAIFEPPSVPGAALPIWATMLMELLCLGIFSWRMWMLARFVPRGVFRKDPKNIVVVATIIITLLDMIIYIAMTCSGVPGLRISRVLRPLFLVNMNESRQIRRTFRNIRNTVPNILSVLILFFFSIALFALMAFKLFESRDLYYRTGAHYFTNYWDSYWDLYVLVTTANSPDVMMPAYDDGQAFAIFFVTYILVNTYIFMNLFLAVIYNSYRMHLEKEISVALKEKKRKLNMSFDLIKCEAGAAEPFVSFQKWVALLGSLQKNIPLEKTAVIWHTLRHAETSPGISRSSFQSAADLLNVRIVTDGTDDNIFATYLPKVFSSCVSVTVVKVVDHKIFSWIFDVLIIANAICIGLNLEATEWFFLPIFLIEIMLRMYAVGPKEFFSRDRLWNWFDFFIIVSAFIVTVIEASLDELEAFPREALDVLLVLRCLRLIKIVATIQGFRVVVVTIVNIAPSLLTYAGVLTMVYYSFAIIGMDTFGNKIPQNKVDQINCGVEALDGSEFQRMGYCRMNFNNIFNSFVTLFVMMVVNQWHVITQGFVLLTSKAARLYFLSFHLTVVLLILNIIVAFVLEAFILEYTIRTNDVEDIVENKIKELRRKYDKSTSTTRVEEQREEPGTSSQDNERLFEELTYKLRVYRGHKNIEVLLQRMFEAKSRLESDRTSNANVGDINRNSTTV